MAGVNNPGNIRGTGSRSTNFDGVTSNYVGSFLNFADASSGYRAIIVNTRSYIDKYGSGGTIDFVTWAKRYAPAADNNNPTAYASALQNMLGTNSISMADLNDPNKAALFATAVGIVEGNKTSGDITAPRDSSGRLLTANYNAFSGSLLAQKVEVVASNESLDAQIDKIDKEIGNIAKGYTGIPGLSDEARSELNAARQSLENQKKGINTNQIGSRSGTQSDAGGGGKVQIRDLKCNLPPAVGTNPLHDYTNYTYRIILSILDDSEYNQFVSNSEEGKAVNLTEQIFPKPGSILIASGGENLKNKNEYAVQDFFFQDLTITSAASASGGAQPSETSWAYDIDFTIIEPIGTTLFERLFYAGQGKASAQGSNGAQPTGATAAKNLPPNKNPESITQTIFLLTIEFKGYGKKTKAGSGSGPKIMLNNISTVGNYSTKYHIPITFSKIDTDITSAGTTYKCSATPAASQIFFTINQANPSTTTIKENQKLKIALQELSDRYTSNQENLPKEFKKTKYVFRIAEDKDISENNTEARSIARELRDQTMFRAGPPADAGRITFMPPKNDVQMKDGRISGGKSGTTGYRPNIDQNFYTGIGTTAIEILHQIMLKTDFITQQVENARNGNKNQGIWWYNIRGNMLINEEKDDKKSPHVEKGKTFEYIIEPYKIYIMNDVDQNDMCDVGIKTFRNYEYIFTGKNEDILKWDINFDALLYSELELPEPSSTTAATGQPNTSTGQAVNASGQTRGNVNQSKTSFPTLSSLDKNQNNHHKLYRYNWFPIDEKNADAGRIKNYPEMKNAAFMESLFRQQTSSQQWELDIDIVGDPNYLAFFNRLNYKRGKKNKPVVPNNEEKLSRLQTKQKTTGNLAELSEQNGVNPELGQYLVGVKFKTPTDVNPATLSYKGIRAADLNGVYTLATIKHQFRNGKFIQSLHLNGTDNKCCPEPNVVPSNLQPTAGGTGSAGQIGTRPLSEAAKTQLSSIDNQLKDPTLSSDARAELEAERSRLLTGGNTTVAGNVINPAAASPLISGQVTSEFGPRVPPRTAGGGRGSSDHGGMDIIVSPGGDPTVYSASQGKVIHSGYLGKYGNTVIVDDGKGNHVYYAHLQDVQTIAVGTDVTTSSKLGTVGSTGNSSGPHLHYEVRTGATTVGTGTTINPRQYNSNLPSKR